MGEVSWVNDTALIRQNPKVTAINSAIEVDLTGQVVADSVGTRVISGGLQFNIYMLRYRLWVLGYALGCIGTSLTISTQ